MGIERTLHDMIQKLDALPERRDSVEWQRKRTWLEIMSRVGAQGQEVIDIEHSIHIPAVEEKLSFEEVHRVFRITLQRLLRRNRTLETQIVSPQTVVEPAPEPSDLPADPLPPSGPRTHKASSSPFLNPLDTED